VFCTEKEREDRKLRRKLLIESRKHLLEAHRNQLDELLCSQVYHTRLFGGLFITAFTSMLTKCGFCRLYSCTMNPETETPTII
jgi:hypothetical protein